MSRYLTLLEKIYLGAIVVIGVAWVIDIPQFFGLSLISAEWMGPLLATGIAAAFLRHPYGMKAGIFDALLNGYLWQWNTNGKAHAKLRFKPVPQE